MQCAPPTLRRGLRLGVGERGQRLQAGTFKPAPAVYRLATHRFGCAPPDISFQSSNRWDIAGAKAFGFRCVWVNRTGAADEYPDLALDRVVGDLTGLL